jgi:DNA modification methylase
MYTAHLVYVFRLARGVLKDDGVLWLNLGDSYSGSTTAGGGGSKTLEGTHHRKRQKNGLQKRNLLKPKDLMLVPHRVALALQADGWTLRSDCVWHKPNAMPGSQKDRPTRDHEYVFQLTKQPKYYFDMDAVRVPHKEQSIKRDEAAHNAAFKARHSITWDKREHSADRNGFCHPKGRALRTVWRINSQPYSEAHFAVFPEALPELCIKASTSQRGECPECGKAWVRVAERETVNTEGWGKAKKDKTSTPDSTIRDGKGRAGDSVVITTGWQPACDCDVGDPIPQTVLDMFGGSGTTARAAVKLGRKAILIELSKEYAELQAERTTVQREMNL